MRFTVFAFVLVANLALLKLDAAGNPHLHRGPTCPRLFKSRTAARVAPRTSAALMVGSGSGSYTA